MNFVYNPRSAKLVGRGNQQYCNEKRPVNGLSFLLASGCLRKGFSRFKHLALHGLGFLRFPADDLQLKHEDV
jgi:hypothetical protein